MIIHTDISDKRRETIEALGFVTGDAQRILYWLGNRADQRESKAASREATPFRQAQAQESIAAFTGACLAAKQGVLQ